MASVQLDWWLFEVSNKHGLSAQMKREEGEIQVQPLRFQGMGMGMEMDINSLNRDTAFSIKKSMKGMQAEYVNVH